MPKKKIRQKHQTGPGDSPADTSDDENQAQLSKCCPHITKAVNVGGLKKTFKSGFSFGECQGCQKKPTTKDKLEEVGVDLILDDSAWLCLQCGNQGCGRNASQHSLQHFQTPHSDSHAVVVNTTSWAIWCYDCDDEVSAEASRRLAECIDFIKKQAGLVTKRIASTPASGVGRVESEKTAIVKTELPKKEEVVNKNGKKPVNGLVSAPKVKGLSNLGNTCFFNAVMQNLAQTKRFNKVLQSHCQENVIWELPSHCADLELKKEVTLSESGSLTQALLDFFTNMNSQGKNGITNPNHLFSQVCKKSPQFRGYQQQDSHELLRHLLDGVRTEEIKRQRVGILRAFDLTEKVVAEEVDEEVKKRIKAYSRQASHTIVDKVFGGQLVSTVLCEECHMPSQVFEPFMDLSLPVGEEKPTRPGLQKRSLSSEEAPLDSFGRGPAKKDDFKPSKHQEKKLKRQAKKDAKRQVKAAKVSASKLEIGAGEKLEQVVSQNTSEDDMSGNDLTDADVEDNDETETSSRHSQTSATFPSEPTSASGAVNCTESLLDNTVTEGTENRDESANKSSEEEMHGTTKSSSDLMNSTREERSSSTETVPMLVECAPEDSTILYEAEPCTDCSLDEKPTSVTTDCYEEGKNASSVNQQPNLITKECVHNLPNRECPSANIELSNASEESSLRDVVTSVEQTNATTENVPEKIVSLQEQIKGVNCQENEQCAKTKNQVELDANMHQTELCAKVARLCIRRKSESKDSLLETPEEKVCNGTGEEAISPVDEISIGSTDSGIGNGEREGRKESQDSPSSKMIDPECLAKSLTTLAPRYQPSSHECSVMSCLHQFTMLELLTGNNKFGCENCSKRKAERNPDRDAKEEMLYTNASKQLLILCPPSILTLHLKRFQQVGMSLKKVNKFVEFPLLLDLAPFCSLLALGLNHVHEGQQQILYSLYGVVEHSGRLTGGHYTAFVKVNPSLGWERQPFLNNFPVGRQEIDQLKTDMCRKYRTQESQCLEDNLKSEKQGVWYHISDSHVSEVSESTVLRCQAYLLFYERIM